MTFRTHTTQSPKTAQIATHIARRDMARALALLATLTNGSFDKAAAETLAAQIEEFMAQGDNAAAVNSIPESEIEKAMDSIRQQRMRKKLRRIAHHRLRAEAATTVPTQDQPASQDETQSSQNAAPDVQDVPQSPPTISETRSTASGQAA